MKHLTAYVIGINDYASEIPNLLTPVNDATAIARVLQDRFGYNVHLKCQGFTHADFEQLWREIEQPAPPKEAFLFYFAGHGVARDSEDGRMRGYLVPSGADPKDVNTFIEMEALHKALHARSPHHVLVVLDCCFAGTFRWANLTRDWLFKKDKLTNQKYRYFRENRAWQAITSTSWSEKALDILHGDTAREGRTTGFHSPFAQAMLDALGSTAATAGAEVMTAHMLAGYLQQRFLELMETVSHDQCPELWPLEGYQKGQYYFDLTSDPQLPDAPELSLENPPWRGLRPYEEKNQSLFFGRDREIARLKALVEATPWTVVTGASGSGKSSLVMAGLLPALRDTTEWEILPVLNPGDDPMAALKNVVAGWGKANPAHSGFEALSAWLHAHPERKLLLVLNQFEELVTYSRQLPGSTSSQQRVFLQALEVFAAAAPAHLRIVITVRSDFEPQFEALAPEVWRRKQRFVIARMTYNDFQDIIQQPASEFSLFFDPPELVEQLVLEVADFPGALPLLSFTLEALFIRLIRRGDGTRTITEADVAAQGGVIGAIRRSADEVFDSLATEADRQMMKNVMLRMVSLAGGETARRRLLALELEFGDETENARLNTVIKKLQDARLILSDLDENDRRYYLPAHEELIRGWSRITDWRLDLGTERFILLRSLSDSAQLWEEGGRQNGQLWTRDPRLRRALTLLGNRKRGLLRRLWP